MRLADGIIDWKALGMRVRLARVARQMTQQVLADQAGISQRAVSNLERGASTAHKTPLHTVAMVARVLEMSLDGLVWGETGTHREGGGRL